MKYISPRDIDSETGEKLSSDTVDYGWQTINPQTDKLMTPVGTNGKISGATLKVDNIQLYDAQRAQSTLWGWCQVEIRRPGFQPNIRYRSKLFKLTINSVEYPRKPEEELTHEGSIPWDMLVFCATFE